MEKTKRSVLNIASNVVTQFLTILFGVIVPKYVLLRLGSEANGLIGSVATLLGYLSILEAGVGAASVQALYRPVSAGERQRINEILSATDRFYKRTGASYFAIVILLSIVYPFTITSEISRGVIAFVVLCNGIPSAVSYFFQGKFNLLLYVEGKSYISQFISNVSRIVLKIIELFLLFRGFGLIALQILFFVTNILTICAFLVYFKKHYAWVDCSVSPDFSSISQSRNALIHQVAGLICNNTDILLLTYFCDLKTVSVYCLYRVLFGSIHSMIAIISGANFAFGQTYHENRELFCKYQNLYEILYFSLTFSMFCIARMFVTPFLCLYTMGIEDINYKDVILPILFVATYLLSSCREPSNNIITYEGMFKETQWFAVLEAGINLVLSVFLVLNLGIYGVLLGTIVALLYRTNNSILFANRKVMHQSAWPTYRRIIVNTLLFGIFTLLFEMLQPAISFDTYLSIVMGAIVCCLLIIPTFIAINFLLEKESLLFGISLLTAYRKRLNKGESVD